MNKTIKSYEEAKERFKHLKNTKVVTYQGILEMSREQEKTIQKIETSKQALQEMKEELESLKTKGSWSSVLEEIDKKLKQIDKVLDNEK